MPAKSPPCPDTTQFRHIWCVKLQDNPADWMRLRVRRSLRAAPPPGSGVDSRARTRLAPATFRGGCHTLPRHRARHRYRGARLSHPSKLRHNLLVATRAPCEAQPHRCQLHDHSAFVFEQPAGRQPEHSCLLPLHCRTCQRVTAQRQVAQQRVRVTGALRGRRRR